jgi:hypothetical protein
MIFVKRLPFGYSFYSELRGPRKIALSALQSEMQASYGNASRDMASTDSGIFRGALKPKISPCGIFTVKLPNKNYLNIVKKILLPFVFVNARCRRSLETSISKG